MITRLFEEDKHDIQGWLKDTYSIDITEEVDDVQFLKNKTFDNLYRDAKECLHPGTVSHYRRLITQCGNNRKKYIKQAIMSLGKAVYKKRNQENTNVILPA
jgi:hypothetical protein